MAPVEERDEEGKWVGVVRGPGWAAPDVSGLASRGELLAEDAQRELLDLDVDPDRRQVVLHDLCRVETVDLVAHVHERVTTTPAGEPPGPGQVGTLERVD